MSHLVLWLLSRLEESLRPRLKDCVPELDGLERDPVGYLASYDGVHVGPRTYPVVAVYLAVPSALLAGWFGWAMNSLLFLNAAPWLTTGFGAVGLVLGPIAVWRLNRGGEAHVVASGVTFSKGRTTVMCPWGVFDPWADLRLESTWVWLPLAVPESRQITEMVDDTVRRTGAAVDAPFASAVRPFTLSRLFRAGDPAAPPEKLKVKDAYAVRGSEFFPLLMRIAAAVQLAAGQRRADEVKALLLRHKHSDSSRPADPAVRVPETGRRADDGGEGSLTGDPPVYRW